MSAALSTPDPAHIITWEQTASGPLYHCTVCKATTYFQSPVLPCPGRPVYLTSTNPADHAAMLEAVLRTAAGRALALDALTRHQAGRR